MRAGLEAQVVAATPYLYDFTLPSVKSVEYVFSEIGSRRALRRKSMRSTMLKYMTQVSVSDQVKV